MNWLRQLVRRLAMLIHRRKFDADLEEEMRLHLELRQEAQLQSAMTADDNRAAARRWFGNTTYLKEENHITWGWCGLCCDGSLSERVNRKRRTFKFFILSALAVKEFS